MQDSFNRVKLRQHELFLVVRHAVLVVDALFGVAPQQVGHEDIVLDVLFVLVAEGLFGRVIWLPNLEKFLRGTEQGAAPTCR